MSSINANQSEDNRDDMSGAEAVTKIKELVGKAQTCFFVTGAVVEGSSGARPMNVRKVDDDGNFWFLSASDSHLNEELAIDPDGVHLYFQGSPHSGFLHVQGAATVSRDKAVIHELWEPLLKTWFTEGEADERITVIKVEPNGGYYWDTKHGILVAGIKMVIGALAGKTLDDSVEGTLKVG
ncbi:pyridoxamine 5'-phosphate oxidase family protein [Verrucomicrobium sp. BvORR106]|uniref:pyridoxamine 5'-phosphate oxidase family protein n=1 Tax=Verrucomicrobium sp. BvORR106 TaxID=1403819 RepID=UPI00057128A0|nr:pyridoxamine 5'-phosphate oxidase family protein [Verrucomicrobium sp. BvORR106]